MSRKCYASGTVNLTRMLCGSVSQRGFWLLRIEHKVSGRWSGGSFCWVWDEVWRFPIEAPRLLRHVAQALKAEDSKCFGRSASSAPCTKQQRNLARRPKL